MSTDWLTHEHLEIVERLLPELDDRIAKRRFQEILYGLTAQYTLRLTRASAAAFLQDSETPLLSSDLEEVNKLLAKGVQHNGVFPELSAVQVGRALRVVSELVGRAAVGTLDLDDQEGLEWVFDEAAEANDGVNRENVRRLENLVRAGLGLDVRIGNYGIVNEQHPA